MRDQPNLENEREEALDIAKQLFYDEEIWHRIAEAKSVFEIDRIMKQARLNQMD